MITALEVDGSGPEFCNRGNSRLARFHDFGLINRLLADGIYHNLIKRLKWRTIFTA